MLLAWVESPDAYGTIAEIGYAAANGVFIALVIPDSEWAKDLWFVQRARTWTRHRFMSKPSARKSPAPGQRWLRLSPMPRRGGYRSRCCATTPFVVLLLEDFLELVREWWEGRGVRPPKRASVTEPNADRSAARLY